MNSRQRGPAAGSRRILAWFAAIFLLLDIALFRWLLWLAPNESGWSELPFYNFEYRARELAATAPMRAGDRSTGDAPGRRRILIAGSSLALYSVLPGQLQTRLKRQGNANLEVRVLSHQGLSALHLLAYADRIIAARPDLLVVPVGTVDFQLERPLMLGIERLDDPASRAQVLSESARYTLAGAEFRMLAPVGWLREYHWRLDLNQKSAGLLAAIFASYRYRLLALDPLELYLDNRLSRGRSYHEYAGIAVGGDGISHRGWTGQEFEVVLTPALISKDGLLVQAPRELLAAAAPRQPYVDLSLWRKNGEGLEERQEFTQLRAWRQPLRTGWQRLELGSGQTAAIIGDRLRARLSHVSYAEAEADYRGVRLTRNAGRDEPAIRTEERELRREDDLYLSYDDREYLRSFEQRILRFERFGTEYLEALKLAREVWSRRAFDPELPGFAAFAEFRERIMSAGIPLLVVNSPENPISLAWYGDSRWYAGYQDFLRAREASPMYFYYDAARLLKMQLFYDYHHLSYYGARTFSSSLANRLESILPAIARACEDCDSGAIRME